MKRLLNYSLLLWLLISCSQKEVADNGAYTCPMHPTVQSASPGLCPVCHMDLVSVSGLASNLPLGEETRLLEPVDEAIRSWAATVRPVNGRLSAPIETQATAVVPEQMVMVVTSRVQGRLEKVFARIPNQPVKKGEILATVYSPELVEAQAQYLRQNSIESRRVLVQLGFPEELFGTLETTRTPIRNVPLLCPISGFLQIQTESQNTEATSSGSDEMKDNGSSTAVIDIPSPGTAVAAGQELFRIFPAHAVVLDIQLPAASTNWIAPGDSVRIEQAGKLDFHTVVQQFNRTAVTTTFVRARANAINSGIPIGTRVKAIVYPHPTEGLWVPSESVLDLGDRKLVFIRTGEFFRPRVVETGRHSNTMIQITSGVTSSEELARHAGTLVDSDALLSNLNHHEKN